ncbi:MAG: hypothetical protein EOO75_03165 [Myxococcales bacterium]|nr:MAG: hypothetical protein EOO75_03165 [Myxococcales bacterium]
MSKLSKVMDLIALTASSNEHEARSAALKACKAIREQKLVLLSPDDPRLAEAAPRPPRRRDPWAEAEAYRRAAEQERQERAARDDQQARWRREQEPAPAPSGDRWHRGLRKKITVQFATDCASCRRPIPEQTPAWWMKGEGDLCPACQEATT